MVPGRLLATPRHVSPCPSQYAALVLKSTVLKILLQNYCRPSISSYKIPLRVCQKIDFSASIRAN